MINNVALVLLILFAFGAVLFRLVKSYQSPWQLFYFSLPLMILFVPGVGESPKLRIEEVLLFLLAPFIIARKPIYKFTKMDVLFLLYGVSIPISMMFGYLLNGTFYLRDFSEFLRLFKYWLIIRLAIGLSWRTIDPVDGLWLFFYAGLMEAGIAFAQNHNSFSINSLYTPFFTNEIHLSKVEYAAFGTLQNYNIFGTFVAMSASIAFSFLLFGKLPIKHKLVVLVGLIIFAIAVIQTSSKSTFVVFLLLFALTWYLRLKTSRPCVKLLYGVMSVVLVVVIAWLGKSAFEKISSSVGPGIRVTGTPVQVLVYRFEVDQVVSGSLERRFSDWELAWKEVAESPLFGIGPAEAQDSHTSYHSEYFMHLRRYGIAGLIIYSSFLLYGLKSAIKLFKKALYFHDRPIKVLAISTIGGVIAFAFMGFFHAVFMQLQLGALFWWLMGMTLGYSNSRYFTDHYEL